MKKFCLLATSVLLFLAPASTSKAALVSGLVLCHPNQSPNISTNDTAIPSVRVIVTNQSGSFSNSTFTASDGSFGIEIPNFDPLAETRDPLSQVYVETLDFSTLPMNSSIIVPEPLTNISPTPAYYITFMSDGTNVVYTSGVGNTATANWLINSPGCGSGGCGLTGNGMTLDQTGRPTQSFNGNITDDNLPDGTIRGHWTHVSSSAKLLFQSTVIQSVSCGTVFGNLPKNGSTNNMIEVFGMGTLTGTGGNRVKFNPVFFTLEVEDHGQPGKNADRYYLRVYTADGKTRLLVSGDHSNPQHVVTVPIITGNLRIIPSL